MDRVADDAALGCPSGLSPAFSEGGSADPRAFVREGEGDKALELAVFGAKCAGCISKIEGGVKALPGVSDARLNLSTGKLQVHWTGGLDPRRITETVTGLGYRATPYDPGAAEDENTAYGRLLVRCLAVAGFAMANVMLLSIGVWAASGGEMGEGTRGLMHILSGLIAIPAALYAGRPFFASAWKALKAGGANMDVPISLAVLLALTVSVYETANGGEHAYFDAAVMLLFFLLIGRWLDHELRNKARSAARDLIALQSVTANRQGADGSLEAVAAKDIKVGDVLFLAPGDRVPVDGDILTGTSDVDTALVTGESVPVTRGEGEKLEAGILNLSHGLTMRATATADRSLIAELVRLVEAGQQAKTRYVRLADRAARAYVPIVHTLAAATFLGWFFIGEAGFRVAMMNAIAVLIITCPCALGLATPAVQIVATGRLFRRGILVKTGDALERLAGATKFVFDKTGTLTMGQLAWTNRETLDDRQFAKAAALARASRHPVARAIAAVAGSGPLAVHVSETPGQGVRGDVDGMTVLLGRAEFVGAEHGTTPAQGTTTWLKIGDDLPVQLSFTDRLRSGGTELVSSLKEDGLSSMMLTGDRPGPAKVVADATGITEWRATLSPGEKTAILQELAERGEQVAMVGDGLNDTPALASAHVSLSPGTAAEAAQSAADFVFQGDSLSAVTEARQTSIKAQHAILQNFAFAALYNLVAAPLAMAGFVTPLIAALAMSGSSLIVTLNALRLSGGKAAA